MTGRALLVALASTVLLAVTPAEVLPVLSIQGFFIEDGSDADPAAVSAAVSDARAAGGDLHVVVLANEPAGGATTFSDAVLDGLGSGTVFTVAPQTVGYASAGDVWSRDELDAATDAALDGSTDTEVVTLFVAMVLDPPGASIWPLFVLFGLIAATIAGFVWWSSRRKRAAEAARLEEARALAQAKLADVADDILDLEDEVQLSTDADVRRSYQQASATYAAAVTEAGQATSVAGLLALATRLDDAIWELDCAEALLDGNPLPPRPVPRQPPPPDPDAAPSRAPSVSRAPERHPAEYVRRTSRRSSYSGPDMTNMLMMMAAGAMGARAGRSRRTTRGATPSARSRTSTPRIRGGGRRRRRG